MSLRKKHPFKCLLFVFSVLCITYGGCIPTPAEKSNPAQPPAAKIDLPKLPDNPSLDAKADFPESLMAELKRSGKNFRPLQGMDAEGNPKTAAGYTIDVAQNDALPAVRRLQQAAGTGCLAFISERHFGLNGKLDCVSVLKTSDPFDALRTMGTNGWNYDLGPEKVIERLKEWDQRFGLTLHGAGSDWVEAQFKRQPDDLLAFAKEVYKFCPDVVDQGTNTVEALAAEMKQKNTLYLWWD